MYTKIVLRVAALVGLSLVAALGWWKYEEARLTGEHSIAVSAALRGTLYYRQSDDGHTRMWQFNANGHGIRPLPPGVSGEPSRHLHAGHRWFLTVRQVDDQLLPDGRPGRALFGVRDDGVEVRLTMDPVLDPAPLTPRWPSHGADRVISWIGRRWDLHGKVTEGGIYTARLLYDTEGRILGLDENPGGPAVALNLVDLPDESVWYNAPVPDIESHDWSPDGKAIVYHSTECCLYVKTLGTGKLDLLTTTPGRDPVWSPDGSHIAFKVAEPLGGIVTIEPGGASPQTLMRCTGRHPFVVEQPLWSPDGRHLAFLQVGSAHEQAAESPCPFDILVASADASRVVNLKQGKDGRLRLVAWR